MGAYNFRFAGAHVRTPSAEPAYQVVTRQAAAQGLGVNEYTAAVAAAAREAFDARHAPFVPAIGDVALPVEHPMPQRPAFVEA